MRDEELRRALVRTLEVLGETLRLLEETVEGNTIPGVNRHQRLRHHAEVVSRLAKELSQ
jgi:hypothetical protein